MQNLSINSSNIDTVQWEEEYYKFCTFESFSIEGGHIDSDFIDCTFKNIDWYWGIFNIVNFINCNFINCVFKGTAFPDCRFVECKIENSSFTKDNLNSNCTFDNTRSYNNKIINTDGFTVKNIA